MSVPDREVDVNRLFRAGTVVVRDLQAKCSRCMEKNSLLSLLFGASFGFNFDFRSYGRKTNGQMRRKLYSPSCNMLNFKSISSYGQFRTDRPKVI